MNVAQDLSFVALLQNASALVQLIMGLLLAVSFLSWYYIFRKMFVIRREMGLNDEFEKDFWSGSDLNALYQSAASARHSSGGLERIFEAGFREFLKLKRQAGQEARAVMEGTRRAMRATFQRENDRLERHLAFLATAGSVSPYVGLFGTVWGIMNAFRGLANVQQATIAHVAPGIAEALIATAMGLFAAIPAVVAYNHFAHRIDRISSRFESFIEEFTNILQRQASA